MSALLIDPPTEDLALRRWVHVEPGSRPMPVRQPAPVREHPRRSPVGKPTECPAPGGRPRGVRPPVVRAHPVPARTEQGLSLTPRGLAVVVTVFLVLMATSAAVLVGGFLSVSNEPPVPVAGQVQRA